MVNVGLPLTVGEAPPLALRSPIAFPAFARVSLAATRLIPTTPVGEAARGPSIFSASLALRLFVFFPRVSRQLLQKRGSFNGVVLVVHCCCREDTTIGITMCEAPVLVSPNGREGGIVGHPEFDVESG